MEATEFCLTLLSGVVIGLLLGILASWIGRKLREKRRAILVMCAWCGKEIRRSGIHGQVVVSRGICPECHQKHFPEDTGYKLDELFYAEGKPE